LTKGNGKLQGTSLCSSLPVW